MSAPDPTLAAPDRMPVTMQTIQQAFQDLDSFLSERISDYRYDIDAGLAKLRHSLAMRASRTALPVRAEGACPEPCAACGPTHTDDTHAWIERHRGPAVSYLAVLEASPLRITSRNTDAFAACITRGIDGERWLISWLPEIVLTRRQVYSAMVLDEILIAHDLDSGTMLRVMGELAADLYLPLEDILRRLSAVKNPPPRPEWLLQAWPG
ncbi:hypothetical protein [Nocardia otitidiscaviarum]|uniref:hypothetical protein n=1 Tax=Nocardia otitidiscaviarum TaxID=1823 RepID=UPI001E378BD9|nr:hypothetical protein [Nocardia otitidiscaviarum]